MPARSRVGRVPCRVEFYAGGRAEETPRRVIYRGLTGVVEGVLGRKRVMDKASGITTDEFTLVLDGRIVKLRRTISGRWSLLLPRP
jgi:hypothetical protein